MLLYLTLIAYAVLGLLSGKVTNFFTGLVASPLKGNCLPVRTLRALLQVCVVAAVPVLLERAGDAPFVESWQVTLPGLLFASFFLSMQSNLMASAG